MENRKWKVGHRGRVVACVDARELSSKERKDEEVALELFWWHRIRGTSKRFPKALTSELPLLRRRIFDFFYSTDHCTTTTTIHHIIQIIIQYQATQAL